MIILRLLQYAFCSAKGLLFSSKGEKFIQDCYGGAPQRALKHAFDLELSEIASGLAETCGTLIFYGTQSGTAKNYARALSYKLSTLLIDSAVCDPSDYNMKYFLKLVNDFGDKITFGFIVSTYGEGGPTDNFSDFFEWLLELDHTALKRRSDSSEDENESGASLHKLKYYIFGLGNSTYRDYNGASKTLDTKLTKLGATRLGEFALSDECNEQNKTFEEWKNTVVKVIVRESGVEVDSEEYKTKFRTLHHRCPVRLISQNSPEWKESMGVHKGCIGLLKRSWKWVEEPPELRGYVETPALTKNIPIYSASSPFYAKVSSSKLMFSDTYDTFNFNDKSLQWAFPDLNSIPTKTEFKDGIFSVERQCIHVDLSIKSQGLEYTTGDYLCIFPRNNPCEVKRLIKALKWEEVKDIPVKMLKNDDVHFLDKRPPIDGAFTPATAFEHYYSITDTLTQERLDILARYATDNDTSLALFDLSADYDKYNDLILKPRRNLADVLTDFKSSFNIPMEVVLCELLDRIAPRSYSIASSSQESPFVATIVAVVVRYALECPQLGKTPAYVRGREGIATSWFQRFHCDNSFADVKGPDCISSGEFPSNFVPLFRKVSTFRLPKKLKTPIIMVGPGTGVAPFRGFVRERCYIANKGKQVGHTILFYGCRTSSSHLYKEEFEDLLSHKPDNFELEIFNTYSRCAGVPRKYVLDSMKEQKLKIWSILNDQKGVLYICGDSKSMGTDVRRTVHEIYLELCPSASQDVSYTDKLASEGRYFEDLW